MATVVKHFQAVENLICEAETTAAEGPDTLALVVALIKLVTRSEIDPYLLNGVLIEAIANTIHSRIPGRRRRQVSVAAVRLLMERLQASDII